MENASKALIMAGSVLIALMIIGALILMFNGLASYQDVGQQNTREAQVIDFNNEFETYNRKNVRGSDLYSLINRVVDYNRRKSEVGTGKDEGQYLAYEPMKLEFTIDTTKLTADGKAAQLMKIPSPCTIDNTSNKFETIMTNITKLETDYGKGIIQDLCTGINKIFITSTATKDRIQAITNFNNVVTGDKKIKQYEIISTEKNEIDKLYNSMCSEIQSDVYKYYEYVQFKRARFDCTKTVYNEKTGRIIFMEFKFTGKFE